MPNPEGRQVYNPFLHERNHLQGPLDNHKQWQSHMKFKLLAFKVDYGTDEVLDWMQVAKQALSNGRVPHRAYVKVVMS